jgi:hypothetical protein
MAFHQGHWQWITVHVDDGLIQVPQRYRHMVGDKAIDVPPINIHGWLNRMFAITRWLANTPKTQTHLRLILKDCIRACVSQIRGDKS